MICIDWFMAKGCLFALYRDAEDKYIFCIDAKSRLNNTHERYEWDAKDKFLRNRQWYLGR